MHKQLAKQGHSRKEIEKLKYNPIDTDEFRATANDLHHWLNSSDGKQDITNRSEYIRQLLAQEEASDARARESQKLQALKASLLMQAESSDDESEDTDESDSSYIGDHQLSDPEEYGAHPAAGPGADPDTDMHDVFNQQLALVQKHESEQMIDKPAQSLSGMEVGEDLDFSHVLDSELPFHALVSEDNNQVLPASSAANTSLSTQQPVSAALQTVYTIEAPILVLSVAAPAQFNTFLTSKRASMRTSVLVLLPIPYIINQGAVSSLLIFCENGSICITNYYCLGTSRT